LIGFVANNPVPAYLFFLSVTDNFFLMSEGVSDNNFLRSSTSFTVLERFVERFVERLERFVERLERFVERLERFVERLERFVERFERLVVDFA
jgi:hypothetical protein